MEIRKYTKDLIPDVIDFEKRLREEEDFWGWEINEKYIDDVSKSFESSSFNESLSLLAYVDGKVVGRIDSSTIYSHFDGSKKAYLDWICVIKAVVIKELLKHLWVNLESNLKKTEWIL
ncbi:hypothetical protein EI71_01956 [Anaeroplasma bactoclasticum]|uniref:Acetyltransferase (GNAT) family protein n=2 Tax=Anaeroplasma bactoclasticum TaxID=2088 RepID=A0A397R2U5_9MOLU|nr:hypothetical protein EI71_01956 [Anaeroplasma bactoclasticum]